MEQVIIIGIDLAKNSFQLHGARADGSVAFRKKVSRVKLLDFVAEQPRCTVATCGGAHHRGREIGGLGHTVRLTPRRFMSSPTSSGSRTTLRTPRRSARRPRGRPCGLWL